jgi:hypothetical protein
MLSTLPRVAAPSCLLAVTIGIVPLAGDGPPAAYSVGAAYDESRSRLIVFGWYKAGQYVGDTWAWDGRGWTRVATTGPLAAPGETWTFNGRAWTRVSTTGPRRRFARLAYDGASRAMLMFGGFRPRAVRPVVAVRRDDVAAIYRNAWITVTRPSSTNTPHPTCV